MIASFWTLEPPSSGLLVWMYFGLKLLHDRPHFHTKGPVQVISNKTVHRKTFSGSGYSFPFMCCDPFCSEYYLPIIIETTLWMAKICQQSNQKRFEFIPGNSFPAFIWIHSSHLLPLKLRLATEPITKYERVCQTLLESSLFSGVQWLLISL